MSSESLKIPFSRPHFPESTYGYVRQALDSGCVSGDHAFTRSCAQVLERDFFPGKRTLLTTSGTAALEMTGLILDLKPGDEVILPSFTFSSTATAYALRGALLKFVDIDPETLNLDPACVARAFTSRTRAVICMHYAGVACEMEQLTELCRARGVPLIEDAAHAIGAKYKQFPLGSLGKFGCLSFHETKNITSGEGGALIVNDSSDMLRAEIVREKGTNRSQFFKGQVDKYTWIDVGSSFLMSDLNAAVLLAQLENFETLQRTRMTLWERYMKNLTDLHKKERLRLPVIPGYAGHNAHLFYCLLPDHATRDRALARLRAEGIGASFHYVPLHSSTAGKKFGEFVGEDRFTTEWSSRLLRLPLYFSLPTEQVDRISQLLSDQLSS